MAVCIRSIAEFIFGSGCERLLGEFSVLAAGQGRRGVESKMQPAPQEPDVRISFGRDQRNTGVSADAVGVKSHRGLPGPRRTHAEVRGASRLVLALGLLLGAFLLSNAPAFAAAPETPVTEAPFAVKASSAIFSGLLNPGKEGEGGTYEFLYRASKTTCEGGSSAPESPGLSLGLMREEVSQSVSGLEAHTEYSVCLLARNGTETAVGPRVSFKTALAPETPVDEEAIEITCTTATLKGVLNPEAEGEPGSYEFQYAPAPECTSGSEVRSAPSPEAPSSGHRGEVAEVHVTDLLPHTTYAFCLKARNGTSDFAQGASVSFTTPVSPPSVSEETTLAGNSTTETVLAEIGPGGSGTSYRAEYVTEAQFQASGFAEASRIPVPDAELPATGAPVLVAESLGSLQPHSGYRFRFVASNQLGTASGAETTFTTAAATLSGASLPDARAYELVSTPGSGEPYVPPTPLSIGPTAAEPRSRLQFQAAANGDAVTYAAEPEGAEGSGATGPGLGNQWLATRTAAGWQSSDITPSNESRATYEAFAANLDVGIMEGDTTPLLPAVAAGCQALYQRAASSGAFSALFTE